MNMINIPICPDSKEDIFCKKVASILIGCQRTESLDMKALLVAQDILVAANYLSNDNEIKAQKKLDETLKFISDI